MLQIQDTLVVSAPYDPDFLETFKTAIPHAERRFDWNNKTWHVQKTSDNLLILQPLLKQYYGYEIPPSFYGLVDNRLETAIQKTFTIYYLGLPKSRQDGEQSSYATTKRHPESGDYEAWNVIFPLSALQTFFEGSDNVPTDSQNYFQVLKLSQDATLGEIKKRYHLMAKQYHPDISDHPEADKLIQLINEAYEILGDKKKRRRYLAAMKLVVSPDYEKHHNIAWYPPYRCGKVTCQARQLLNRWHVEKILVWDPIVNQQKQHLFPYFKRGEIHYKWS
jgi:hypothetical protein